MEHPFGDPFSFCTLTSNPIHPMKPYKSTPMMLSPCISSYYFLNLRKTTALTRYAIPCYPIHHVLSYLIFLPTRIHMIHLQC